MIRAEGEHFTSGGDIAGFMEVDPVDFTDLGHNVTAAARSPKPVIAAIDGYCFGVGLRARALLRHPARHRRSPVRAAGDEARHDPRHPGAPSGWPG